MKTLITTLIAVLMTIVSNAQEPLHISNFNMLNNTSWEGQLTYKDYQSGNQRSVDTKMQIEIKGDRLITNIQYTYEPKKNNSSSVKLKKNGTYFGNERIISNTLDNGIRTFITTYKGRDNGKKATMYITHQFSQHAYKVTKEVQYDHSNERFIRNTYQYLKL
ncbi:hypothetical protein [uncultured Psychroserpens sp.]|uniref:hypothetical protein n=1 Tax=uncultured Psychroserpens sp. TaxID=255436 RepID=UPI0026379B70|nr:hypothetical protein [uncultured Psychroserpens sp.]